MLSEDRLVMFLFESTADKVLKWFYDKDGNFYHVKLKIYYETECYASPVGSVVLARGVLTDYSFVHIKIQLQENRIHLRHFHNDDSLTQDEYPELISLYYMVTEFSRKMILNFLDVQMFTLSVNGSYHIVE